MAQRISLFVLLLTITFTLSYAQQDFNDYRTLKSAGDVPEDFRLHSTEKIDRDLKAKKYKMSIEQQRKFLDRIHFAIDELLHSGSVSYGDEVSVYLNAIAAKLLQDKPELAKELRFYTIKSNEANALSTDQGIIFVTTGLLAQLTSEAQLAFVLAHEIAHFDKKHVQDSYKYTSNKNKSVSLKDLRVHSKENELEADLEGLKIYEAAGYSQKEVLSTFDVLMYSYLPFDEEEVPLSYFASDLFYLPDFLVSDKEYEITAVEDYNDEQSYHPNIKKRKTAIEKAIEDNPSGNTGIFQLGKEQFEYVRDMARFESVRTDLLDQQYPDAIYSIYLLEKKFPESIYLQRSKAQAWLGIAQHVAVHQKIVGLTDLKAEGKIGKLYYFFRKLKNEARLALAMRTIYDLQRKYPNDEVINQAHKMVIKAIAKTEKFNLEKYADKSFKQLEIEATEVAETAVDTLKTEVKEESKYDKIKKQKGAVTKQQSSDTTKYYLFGLSDVIKDTNFTKIYQNYKKMHNDNQDARNAYDDLSKAQKRAYDNKKEELQIGMEKCIYVQPIVSFRRKHREDNTKAAQLKKDITEVVRETASKNNIQMETIDLNQIAQEGTSKFNEENTVHVMYLQQFETEVLDPMPVDYLDLRELGQKYNTTNVLFTMAERSYEPNINSAWVFTSCILFPTFPITLFIYIPIKMITGVHTKMAFVVLDTETGGMKSFYAPDQEVSFAKGNLKNYLNQIFSKYKQ